MTLLKEALTGRDGRPVTTTAAPTPIPEKVIKPWKLPPQKKYVLKNASVVDPVDGVVYSGATVKLAEGVIQSVQTQAPASSLQNATIVDKGSIVVDLAGHFLCPGLIDAHVHISSVPGSSSLDDSLKPSDAATSHLRQPFQCAQALKRGFTALRDCGGATLALKQALADDVFAGPRLFIANHALSQTGGHGDHRAAHDTTHSCAAEPGVSVVCDGVSECVRAAREQLRTGADFLKIMVGGGVASPTDALEHTQFTADEVRAIAEVAAGHDTWVTAHAYTPRAIRHAVDAGVRGIEHGNFLDEETAAYMAARDVWLTPTLVTYEAMASDKYAGFLPPANQAKNQAVLARGLESLKIADRAGVSMCFGSDLLGPLTAEQSREFGIRARALSNVRVLQSATVNPARMLRQENFLGQIREGFAADLLILNASPLDDVAILDAPEKHVLAVIKNGRVYESRWSKLPEDVHKPKHLIE
ncbi:amidohydrolase [Xylariaceae sp. FL0662B]|nr:amidohydrolase [Xylariaceae sp. FL0662B]